MPFTVTAIGRLAVILFSFQSLICAAQSPAGGQTVYDKDFKWTISIPKGFERLSDSAEAKMQQKGVAAIEGAYNGKVVNKARVICAFKSDQLHYFEANSQPNEDAKNGGYDQSFKQVSDVLYHTFEVNMPKVRLDSSYSREIVAGKEFHVFQVAIHITPEVTMHMLMYSRMFGEREFSVNMLYVKEEIGKQLLAAWRKSHFD
jgi:hypothetical protein